MFQMKKREVKGFKKQGVQIKISIKTHMCMHGCACTHAHAHMCTYTVFARYSFSLTSGQKVVMRSPDPTHCAHSQLPSQLTPRRNARNALPPRPCPPCHPTYQNHGLQSQSLENPSLGLSR